MPPLTPAETAWQMQQIDKTSRRAGFWICTRRRRRAADARLKSHRHTWGMAPASHTAYTATAGQPPSVRQASPMASSSAWPAPFFLFHAGLRPRPTMRSSSVITHPTGTSPSAAASWCKQERFAHHCLIQVRTHTSTARVILSYPKMEDSSTPAVRRFPWENQAFCLLLTGGRDILNISGSDAAKNGWKKGSRRYEYCISES